ncbi:MAG: response regulator transcription factor [Sulfuricella sp.]|nr:response regulator transcription factor [Sulfuricella sp.]
MMHLLLTGMTEKEIAQQLGLAASTTHQYVTGLYRKINVKSRAALTSLWLNRAA